MRRRPRIAQQASGSTRWRTGLLHRAAGSFRHVRPADRATPRCGSTRRRGIAIGDLHASGNYIAGALWPPLIQHFTQTAGWRADLLSASASFCTAGDAAAGAGCTATGRRWRRRPAVGASAQIVAPPAALPLGLQPATLQALLIVAGVACCVAMAMPQVHIVAYCSDLGIGPARGAQMLSLMLGMGIISRLASGWIADRIGGLRTLALGSLLQGVALLMFLFADGVASLFLVSALFGLFQGGIVPSYPLVVREYFDASEVGARVGTVLMATLFGMALGGWMSGAIFDWTGSYRAAFVNGIGWNLLNLGICVFLLLRVRRLRLRLGSVGVA
jgi:MFS family permease